MLCDCNHSVWDYQNDQLVLKATGKCLCSMNSQDVKMVECNKADEQINHHIHFKIVDNKYICIENNEDPVDYCLNGKDMKFKTSKDENSEWYIEKWNSKLVDSITDIKDIKIAEFIPKTSTTTTNCINNCEVSRFPCIYR